MPSNDLNDAAADAAIDQANQGSPASLARQPEGLPVAAPDVIEQEVGDQLDNIVPTRGYRLTPTVGLGGSAGSIQALARFFEAMPADSGLVFVVVLHLSPEHESTLAELLARHTAMPVVQAEDGVNVAANHVYVIPPGKHLSSVDGHLKLSPLEPAHGKRMAVDVFFRTLADTHGAHAAAVVLSGADGDGAIGLKRIKERGGLTIAQDPDEAEHDSMPRSAIATGMVDWVLTVQELPARLREYFACEKRLLLPPENEPETAAATPYPSDAQETTLREVLAFLHARTGRDFAYYKRATVLRRISRRMQINGTESLAEYLSFLRTHPGESGALLQDMLISVTNFFRDREAFTALEAHIPHLFRGKGPNDTVRVWVAACASGEEAYSVAMLFFEHARTLETPPGVQVFATDLSEEVVRGAREGVYPATIATDVSEERLARFFHREPRGYRVRRELREAVLFAQHDLLKDSPFSKLDLVTCRNLLIYLNRDAQKRTLEIFHFALVRQGTLFLGTSETVEDSSELFTPLDKKHRLYAARLTARVGLPFPVGVGTVARALETREQASERPVLPAVGGPAVGMPAEGPPSERAATNELHLRVLAQAGPAVLIVNAQHEIVHLSGAAGRYLQFGGEMTRDLLQIIHPELRVRLRAALYGAAQNRNTVDFVALPMEIDRQEHTLDKPVNPARETASDLLVVAFSPHPGGAPSTGAAERAPEADPAAEEFERELERLKNHLRDVQEQHDVTVEEHKASHEELQAINEELRSAGEELETSREELQALNEELTTVNTELKVRVDELGRSNGDLHNLMNATSIGTVFLDRELRVVRYTPEAEALFNLIPSDLGRPLAHLKHCVDYPELEADAKQVLRTLVPTEREITALAEARWFLAKTVPYRSLEDRIEGVVLTLVDVTARKQADQRVHESEEQFRSFVAATSDTVYKMSPDWTEMRHLEGKRFLADTQQPIRTWLDRYIPAEEQPTVLAAIREAIPHKRLFELEHRVFRADGTVGWVFSRAIPLLDARGEINEWIGAAHNVTERKRTEEALRESEEQYRTLFSSIDEGFCTIEVLFDEQDQPFDYRFLTINPAFERHTGMKNAVGRTVREFEPGHEPFWFETYGQIVRTGEASRFEHEAAALGKFYDVYAFPIGSPAEHRVAIIFNDVSERRETAAALERTGEQVRVALATAEAANRAKDHFLAVLSHELRTPLMPITMALATLARRPDVPAPVRKAHEMIQRNVELEARFIDEMLDVTRIGRGKLELARTPMDLHEALRQAVEVSSMEIEAKSQRLTVTLEAGEHRLQGDFARLQQVVWNLLKNASKFTPAKGEIRLRSSNAPGRIVVEVADTGIGMEAEAIERIFQPFEQASVSVTREFGGLGLGLSIARGTVEAHGGSLHASSSGPGQGATFTVNLPLTA